MTDMTPAPISVERLRELLAKATALPWEADAGTVRPAPESPDRVTIAYCSGEGSPQGEADAELIAAAINALPALLHQLEEMEAEVGRLRNGAEREQLNLLTQLREAERAREGDRAALAKLERECRTYQGQHENAYVDHQRDGRESYHPGRAIASTFKWMGDRIAAFLAASKQE